MIFLSAVLNHVWNISPSVEIIQPLWATYSSNSKVFPKSCLAFPLVEVVSIVSCHITMNLQEEPVSIFSIFSHQTAVDTNQISFHPLFLKLNKPSYCSLSLYAMCFNALVILVTLCWTHSTVCHCVLLRRPKLDSAGQIKSNDLHITMYIQCSPNE